MYGCGRWDYNPIDKILHDFSASQCKVFFLSTLESICNFAKIVRVLFYGPPTNTHWLLQTNIRENYIQISCGFETKVWGKRTQRIAIGITITSTIPTVILF